MGGAGRIQGNGGGVCRVWSENFKERESLEDIGIEGRAFYDGRQKTGREDLD